MHHRTSNATRWAALGLAGLAGLAAAGSFFLAVACGSDREKARQEARDELQADFDKRVQQEVDRRLAKELPKLEERVRAQLSGKAVPPGQGGTGANEPRPAGRAADPAGEPVRDPVSAKGADAGAPRPGATGPSALPPDAMEAKAPEVDPQGLVVSRVLLAKKLVERKPEGEGTAFTLADERIYCYIDAKNPKGPERKLTVVWHHDGKVFHRLSLRVGVGYVWRTWAFLTIRPGHVGNWRCGVFNEEGQLLKGADFSIAK